MPKKKKNVEILLKRKPILMLIFKIGKGLKWLLKIKMQKPNHITNKPIIFTVFKINT